MADTTIPDKTTTEASDANSKQIPISADTTVASTTGASDMVTREHYEMMMKQMKEKDSQLAQFRAFKDNIDAGNRRFIQESSEQSTTWIKGLLSSQMPEAHKELMDGIVARVDAMGKTPAEKLDSEMPLAVLTHYASVDKRKREESDLRNRERDSELQKTSQEKDDLQQELDKKHKMYTEMTQLAEERQASCEDLARKLAHHIGVKRKEDFAYADSRHVGLAKQSTIADANAINSQESNTTNAGKTEETKINDTGIPAHLATGGARVEQILSGVSDPMGLATNGLTSTIHAASMGKSGKAPMDMSSAHDTPSLASWISGVGGGGSSRIMRQEHSAHKWLGGDGGEGSADGMHDNVAIGAAIAAASSFAM